LADAVNGSDDRLPPSVIGLCRMLLTHITSLGEQIGLLERNCERALDRMKPRSV
jgi:hypothetical protein